MFWIQCCLLILGSLAASGKIILRFLQFFQQEEYDNRRFLRWWIRTRSFEKRVTLTAVILAVAGSFFVFIPSFFHLPVSLIGAAVLAYVGLSYQAPPSKKPLVMTARAKRIFIITLILQALLLAVLSWLVVKPFSISLAASVLFFFIALFIQLTPLALVAANKLLSPFESLVQRKYLREAREILQQKEPYIIGITGSYGKTSIKHILSHILSSHTSTLATPGSVNTLMGITKIIRERLRVEHNYFIVEMGAYKKGSIKSLCKFTPPKLGIITAIGLAHMERFKSMETVAKAKAELVQSLPMDGIAVLNGDDPLCRKIAKDLSVNTYFYGRDEDKGRLDCRILNSETTLEGTHCVLEYKGQQHKIFITLFGDHQVMNLAGAFLAAVLLDVPPVLIAAAVRSMPQVAHRLVVNRGTDGVIVIDDSYNSNPTGFMNALKVLQSLPGEQKILITPGMVELGEKEKEEHERVASIAAQTCDVIGLVASHRMMVMRSELLRNGFPADQLYEFTSFQETRKWLDSYLCAGDAVLFENDLPDVYESPSAF